MSMAHFSIYQGVRNKKAVFQMEYRLQSMYDHMVGRTASVVSPFYSLLPFIHFGLYSVQTLGFFVSCIEDQ